MTDNKRQLTLDLLARDKTGQATKSAADNLDRVGESAAAAAHETEKLGKESDHADEQVEKFGKSNRTAAEHVERLNREIDSVERELKKLAADFAEAQTAADRLDLSRAIRRTQGDLRKLEASKKILAEPVEIPTPDPKPVAEAAKGVKELEADLKRLKVAYVGASTASQRSDLSKSIQAAEKELSNLEQYGEEAAQGFFQSFSETAGKYSGPIGAGVMGGVIASAVALSPAVGATISAAVLGGTAAGGVIGGFMLAKRDVRVKAAAKDLGDTVMESLNKSAAAFVPATLKGIQQIKGSFEKISGNLTSIFNHASGYVEPLIEGVSGLIERAIGGVDKAVAAAGPVIDVLRRNLPELGAVIGSVFDTLADDAPAAASALEQVFHLIEGGIIVVGGLLDTLTNVYGGLAELGLLGPEAKASFDKYAAGAKTANSAASGFSGAQEIVADKTKKAAAAIDLQREALIDLGKEERARVDPLFRFVEAQKSVTKAQKDYTDAVGKYGKDSDQAREKLRALTDSALDLSDAADQVGVSADGKLTPALQRALQKAGLTKGEIASVRSELDRTRGEFEKYGRLSPVAHIFANTSGADGPIRKTAALIAKLPNSKHISVTVGVSGASAAVDVAKLLGRRAAGGPVKAGMPYIVGEKRPEVFVPNQNGTIIPSISRAGSGSGGGAGMASAGDGGGWVPIRGDAVLDALVQAIASRVSAKGGRAAQLGIRFT